jgi:hypothetical protein
MIVICIYLQVFFFGSRYENKSRGDLFLCCIIYFYIISLSFFSYRFYCYMLVFISKYFAYLIFFFVDPGQPIWPVTRSLDRVDHRVGFQNYGLACIACLRACWFQVLSYMEAVKANWWLMFWWVKEKRLDKGKASHGVEVGGLVVLMVGLGNWLKVEDIVVEGYGHVRREMKHTVAHDRTKRLLAWLGLCCCW